MLSISECRILHSTMQKYLNILLENRFFYGNEDYREGISEAVRSEMPLFKFLSSRLQEDESYKRVVDGFREFFLLELSDVRENLDYEDKDFDVLKDEVNYLRVCVQNICRIDLDNFDKEKLSNEDANFNKYQDKDDAESVFNNVLNEDISLDKGSNSLDQEFGNLLLRSHAYERLNKDINEGIIYIYKTKPIINVVLKYLLFAFSILGVCCSLVLLILCMVNGGDKAKNISYFLLFVLSSVYFSVSLIYLGKTFKNDNFKYSWQKKNFFLVFVSMMIGLWTFTGDFKQFSDYRFLVWALIFILVITSSIYSLAYFFLQPERDNELIDSILEKHISDISSKGVSFK